jgi:lipopolysaccharide biosynthesis glycosyltransferase
MPDAIAATGVTYPYKNPPLRGKFAGRNICALRLYVPLMFASDWYFYMDGDVIFERGQFFPEIMEYTNETEKVLFAVQDYGFIAMPEFRKRVQAYRKDYPGNQYYGSGFMLMRGGSVLRKELEKTIRYFAKHLGLAYVDQDALNLAFDTKRVFFLPSKFCVVPALWKQARDWLYSYHPVGMDKSPGGLIFKEVVGAYRAAKEKWASPKVSAHGHAA